MDSAITVDGITASFDKPLYEHGQVLLNLSKNLGRTIRFGHGDRGRGAGSVAGDGGASHDESCSQVVKIDLMQMIKTPVKVEWDNLCQLVGRQARRGTIAVDGVTTSLDKPLH